MRSKCGDEMVERLGNAAAMREALVAIKEVAERDMRLHVSMSESDKDSIRAWSNLLMSLADSALFSPPRNCDIGTVQERHRRFLTFCNAHVDCVDCPIKAHWTKALSCGILWDQMPYEAEEGGKR